MAKTKLNRSAEAAVRAWCQKHGIAVSSVAHVFPRAYVVGHAAPLGLVVSVPWQDAEPQVQSWAREFPLKIVHKFDESLSVGMWCAAAYVASVTGGEFMAVPFDE